MVGEVGPSERKLAIQIIPRSWVRKRKVVTKKTPEKESFFMVGEVGFEPTTN